MRGCKVVLGWYFDALPAKVWLKSLSARLVFGNVAELLVGETSLIMKVGLVLEGYLSFDWVTIIYGTSSVLTKSYKGCKGLACGITSVWNLGSSTKTDSFTEFTETWFEFVGFVVEFTWIVRFLSGSMFLNVLRIIPVWDYRKAVL